jgi:SET domain-containing protein
MDQALPHDDVHARLGVSAIHGIGVFAIVPIDAGVRLFGPEKDEIQPVAATLVDQLPDPKRRLYIDFCVPSGGAYFAPASFNDLTIAWYLNHDDAPNVACTQDDGFVALRDIAAGEELTLDYRTFHPGPLPWQQ